MTVKFKISTRLYEKENLCICNYHTCQAACCRYGVWADIREAEDILKNSALILPFMEKGRPEPSGWFDRNPEEDHNSVSGKVVASTVAPDASHPIGSACVFLRHDWSCSLQIAAENAGLHPWRFKPFYCILHPLDLDDDGKISLPESDVILKEISNCLQKSEKPELLIKIFQPELEYLMGLKEYQALLNKAEG